MPKLCTLLKLKFNLFGANSLIILSLSPALSLSIQIHPLSRSVHRKWSQIPAKLCCSIVNMWRIQPRSRRSFGKSPQSQKIRENKINKTRQTHQSQKRKANEFKLLLNSAHKIHAHVTEMATLAAACAKKRQHMRPEARTDALFVAEVATGLRPCG